VTKIVSVTNHSPIDCKYQWCFIDSNVTVEDKDEDEGKVTGQMKLGG